MSSDRIGFSSKLGGLLAAAGSAVGLGNIWRFPTQAGENGGSAFLIVYIAVILIFGIPLLISEFAIGRHARANVGNAYSVLAPNSWWKIIGFGSVFAAFTILSYYNVVVGWVFYYTAEAVSAGSFLSVHEDGTLGTSAEFFGSFVSNPYKPLICLFIVTAIIHVVIVSGVRKGIERSSKVLVPALFLIMIMLVLFSATMPGASKGYEFLFKLNFSDITPDVVLSAVGQCFYSFSLGMGLVTYASYFRRDVNLNRTALSVASLDTLVAVLAGLIIFPAVFSVAGMSPAQGAGLVFISLPNVFNSALQNHAFLNWLIPSAFYGILLVAALTSTIFLHEVSTAFIAERAHISRTKSATIVSIALLAIGAVASLSMGPLSDILIFNMNIFDFLDFFTAKIILPLTGLGAALFVGYKMTTTQLWTELTSYGKIKFIWLIPFLILVRFIIPVLIIIILVSGLTNISISDAVTFIKSLF